MDNSFEEKAQSSKCKGARRTRRFNEKECSFCGYPREEKLEPSRNNCQRVALWMEEETKNS